MARFTGDDFDAGDSFFLRFMREHRAGDDISDRVNAFHVCAKILVHFDSFLFVELNTDFLRAHPLRKWTPSHRNQDLVGVEL